MIDLNDYDRKYVELVMIAIALFLGFIIGYWTGITQYEDED